jgi:hypothetical protein
MWICYAFIAAFFLAICNTNIHELTIHGFIGILYYLPGTMICGIVYYIY